MIRQVRETDLERCFEIESLAYAGDEAASREKIARRIHSYPQGFIVYEKDGAVVGFINSGATHQVLMSDDGFKELIGHDANGQFAVILSVAVHPEHQRQGIAGQLMYSFIDAMTRLHKSEIHLMCQPELLDYYQRFGYRYLQDSASEHGGLSWKEMKLDL
ncbi:GNAT family N-acetyltransferase [Bacterioplanes sanyensis]|uniref:GNAT family N-acetyltransferase n=1 Tax=Bacterioplanes sanyensis TaxID=1249553 RepID=UPI0018EE8103|nr:GNAT family N-acetyltransferase [Bacterioplanes sanyensis]